MKRKSDTFFRQEIFRRLWQMAKRSSRTSSSRATSPLLAAVAIVAGIFLLLCVFEFSCAAGSAGAGTAGRRGKCLNSELGPEARSAAMDAGLDPDLLRSCGGYWRYARHKHSPDSRFTCVHSGRPHERCDSRTGVCATEPQYGEACGIAGQTGEIGCQIDLVRQVAEAGFDPGAIGCAQN